MRGLKTPRGRLQRHYRGLPRWVQDLCFALRHMHYVGSGRSHLPGADKDDAEVQIGVDANVRGLLAAALWKARAIGQAIDTETASERLANERMIRDFYYKMAAATLPALDAEVRRQIEEQAKKASEGTA